MITEQENKIRSEFFWEKGEKAYTGHINDGDKVIWNENYVKWLESKLHQHTVISSVCKHEWYETENFYIKCKKCNQLKNFMQTDL